MEVLRVPPPSFGLRHQPMQPCCRPGPISHREYDHRYCDACWEVIQLSSKACELCHVSWEQERMFVAWSAPIPLIFCYQCFKGDWMQPDHVRLWTMYIQTLVMQAASNHLPPELAEIVVSYVQSDCCFTATPAQQLRDMFLAPLLRIVKGE